MATIVALLEPLVADGTVASLLELGSVAAADPAQRLRVFPALVVVPQSTAISGQAGLGSGRTITERLAVITQVRERPTLDAEVGADMQTIRAAVYDALEKRFPAAGWSPLLYDGGEVWAIEDGIYSRIDWWTTQTATHTYPRP